MVQVVGLSAHSDLEAKNQIVTTSWPMTRPLAARASGRVENPGRQTARISLLDGS